MSPVSAPSAASRASSPGSVLAEPVGDRISLGADLWGFGGLHGGLTLALLTSAMRRVVADLPLRSATAQLLRPIRGEVDVRSWLIRQGRTVSAAGATAGDWTGASTSAAAVFGASARVRGLPLAPPAPAAPRPDQLDVFTIPTELVPFVRHIEIRPVNDARPYAGGDRAELVAWIRLVADDEPPDELRLIFLLDALAPSYAAVLSTAELVPTVELTVRPAPALARATSPWVLLRATTSGAGADGWIDERIDAWGPDGTHLGSAQQLRVVVGEP